MVWYNPLPGKETATSPGRGRVPCLAPIRFFVQRSPTSFWRRRGWKCAAKSFLTVPCSGRSWRCWSMSIPTGIKCGSAATWDCPADRFIAGGNDGQREISPWRMTRAAVVRPIFPPRDRALVKALACERVAETGEPISRQSLDDLTSRRRKHWASRSAAAPYGEPWTRMPSSPGSTSIGYFHETRNSWKRPDRAEKVSGTIFQQRGFAATANNGS